jgi:hypothetical protein
MKLVYIWVALDAVRCRPRRATQAQPEPIRTTATRAANAVDLAAFQVISGVWRAADSRRPNSFGLAAIVAHTSS